VQCSEIVDFHQRTLDLKIIVRAQPMVPSPGAYNQDIEPVAPRDVCIHQRSNSLWTSHISSVCGGSLNTLFVLLLHAHGTDGSCEILRGAGDQSQFVAAPRKPVRDGSSDASAGSLQ
jgi:hypothetical protein